VNADHLDAHAVAEPEPVTVASDGHEIEGWLLLPPGAERDGGDGGGDEETAAPDRPEW